MGNYQLGSIQALLLPLTRKGLEVFCRKKKSQKLPFFLCNEILFHLFKKIKKFFVRKFHFGILTNIGN